MKKVAFRGGLLINGTGAPALANSLVLIEDGKISYAGADKTVDTDYAIVDIAGKTIMPGLIDAHLHFSGNLTDTTVIGLPKIISRKRLSLCSRRMSVSKQGLQR